MFQAMTRNERTLLNRALDRWGVYNSLRDQHYLINCGKVCLVSKELATIITSNLQPDAAGLVIGEMGKRFVPTLAGAVLFSKSLPTNSKFYVRVNAEAEKLILYGRDIMGGSVLEAAPDIGANEVVIILGHRGDAIGVGRTRFSGQLLMQKERITITTVLDAGMYLRDEG